MDRFEKYLDKVVKQVLDETLNKKVDNLVSEIEKKSKLHGKQHKIDVAEPKGKIKVIKSIGLMKGIESTLVVLILIMTRKSLMIMIHLLKRLAIKGGFKVETKVIVVEEYLTHIVTNGDH